MTSVISGARAPIPKADARLSPLRTECEMLFWFLTVRLSSRISQHEFQFWGGHCRESRFQKILDLALITRM